MIALISCYTPNEGSEFGLYEVDDLEEAETLWRFMQDQDGYCEYTLDALGPMLLAAEPNVWPVFSNWHLRLNNEKRKELDSYPLSFLLKLFAQENCSDSLQLYLLKRKEDGK